MSMLPYAAIALAGAFASQSAAAACYRVYAPNQEIVYRASTPPVDMSREIHETLPRVAPGGTLVFSLDEQGCEITINKLPLTAVSAPGGMRPARADRG
ncbi:MULTISPECIES: hypothetical protein [unclassified Acidovorax]|uniref:hypothetical protein n=1 Tax=unclassified Acidovorax TaxID=2684926 RepID=UPI000B3FD6E7|nr:MULTISPECIES: hypothetical protein [unclassified Acidovorax]MBU4422675.1 hypothetical protein [Gammaproteobacteria bacterium]